MGTILQRIQDLANNEGIKITVLEKNIGASKGVLSRAIKHGTDINIKWLQALVENYPQYSTEWILTGKNDMLKSMSNTNEVTVAKENISLNSKYDPNTIPFYNLPVSAGALGVLSGWDQRDPSGYVKFEAFEGCECVLPVVGVSMEPIIYSGDWIGIKRINNVTPHWDFLQTDVIYLIVTHEDRMIKFIDEAAMEDYIVCKSPNSKPFRVLKNDILELYRVKAVVRAL